MRYRLHHRLGFTLYEVMAAVLLLTIFFSAAGYLFRSTVLLSTGSQNLCDQASRTDIALNQLRADVWNCRAIKLADGRSVDLSMADGKDISWKIDSQKSAMRTDASGQSEKWDDLGADWSLSADKMSLSISDGTTAPVRMISQNLLTQSE